MLTQMAKYLDTVYVSGWQSSSTASASDEPGPDLADYPYVRVSYHYNIKSNVLIHTDHRPKQGRPSFHGTTLPRPQTTRRENHDQIEI
jgi:isocitrate lyase